MRASVFLIAAGLTAVAGCSVGPDYHRPAALPSQPLPAAFNGVEPTTNLPAWKVTQPSAHLPRGAWWKIFDDAELNRLENLAATNNQDLDRKSTRLNSSHRC